MTSAIQISKWVYAALVHLYPYKFQIEFADEMQADFAAVVCDAAKNGTVAVVAAFLRELRDLPINLLREHWHIHKETFMRNVQFSNNPVRSAWWGAVGFGAAFAVAKMVSFTWHSGGIIVYALAGALGGALFGLASESRKQVGLFSLIGALAFGVGYPVVALSEYNFAGSVSPKNPAIVLIVIMEPIIIGALVGILIGAVQKDWKQSARLALASAAGFGLGRVAGFALSVIVWGIVQAIDSYRPGFNGQLSSWVVSVGSVMLWVVASIVSGIVGGATLGMTVKRRQLDNSPTVCLVANALYL